MAFERITVNPSQMGGVPCMRGLRIPVASVVSMVSMLAELASDVIEAEHLSVLLLDPPPATAPRGEAGITITRR